jgi:putative ABC transport system permease protein
MIAILKVQGSIFPQGRMLPVVLRGIDPKQTILKLPTHRLDTVSDAIPAIIGGMMAQSAKLNVGDRVVIRWRDDNGTFDATEILITGIFSRQTSLQPRPIRCTCPLKPCSK